MATKTYTYVNGQTADGGQIETDFNEIYNNITNANIASSAAIATSKLEISSGTSTSPILNNGIWYKVKNSSGTATNLITVSTNNHFLLGQLLRQGGSSTSWGTNGTTNYTQTTITVQCGSISVAGSSSATVTFPQAFKTGTVPLVLVSANASADVNATATCTAADTATVYNWNASTRTISWIAIGAAD